MQKPLWRWTLGPCLQQGLDILIESVYRTTKALGVDTFDWMICYNSISAETESFLKTALADKPVSFFRQNWADCPIDDVCQSPQRKDGSFEVNGTRCGGTLWKACPARMRIDTHEIVMDNDVVILNKFHQLEEFLASSDKALILEEPIRFYGRFAHLFPEAPPYLNSGLMGFPPNYDFAAQIRRTWELNGRLHEISQADEQGLLTYTLSQLPSVRISQKQVLEVLAKDYGAKITGNEDAIHFTQANRIPRHLSWQEYQRVIRVDAIM
jgi:hypothetical protein